MIAGELITSATVRTVRVAGMAVTLPSAARREQWDDGAGSDNVHRTRDTLLTCRVVAGHTRARRSSREPAHHVRAVAGQRRSARQRTGRARGPAPGGLARPGPGSPPRDIGLDSPVTEPAVAVDGHRQHCRLSRTQTTRSRQPEPSARATSLGDPRCIRRRVGGVAVHAALEQRAADRDRGDRRDARADQPGRRRGRPSPSLAASTVVPGRSSSSWSPTAVGGGRARLGGRGGVGFGDEGEARGGVRVLALPLLRR